MRWGGSISPHTAASRSKALGLGNCPSTVCAHSSSFLSHNLRLSHPKPRCDLGVHGLPSADDPSFQQPLPTPPCLGMQLGTAWEPGEVLSAHTGALQGGGIAGMLQAKGKLGSCPCSWAQEGQGLLQKGWWEMPTPQRVFNLLKSLWKA